MDMKNVVDSLSIHDVGAEVQELGEKIAALHETSKVSISLLG